ncbi:hypothetical protein GCM10011610_67020 [Nocardia rhizosphaerihabitans]|uniref:Uncharacterized protein n=2 Tax=Nocardia rhizosphaerihabitans TaxID=1691570 RepID=A0ABQ2L1J7_9NOCA|nr:hypothetical protein GCM10011610_67020 [Nocardia rhizosphaerihabitans]
MATQGWFNHYDDPDEFWDDEPFTPRKAPWDSANGSAVEHSARPVAQNSLTNSAPQPESAAHNAGGANELQHRSGSSFVSMDLDHGLLPIRLNFRAGWSRHVAPHEVSEELMLAYRGAVATRMAQVYSGHARPSRRELSVNAVPDRRTMLMVLLETETWEQFSAVSSSMNCGSWHEARGHVMDDGGRPVSLTGDRRYLRSITVQPNWAAVVHPDQIADEVLWCAEIIRAQRPNFSPRGDYSRYSDEDLEYGLDRHRVRLLNERVG